MADPKAIEEPRTLRDQVVALLRKRLVLGEMQAGELYSATTIAQELGVSSSPVREALLQLVDQGMLEPVRNRGFRVMAMTEQDRKEIHQLRSLIEVPVMQELTRHQGIIANQGEFRAIAHEGVAAAERADYVGYIEADRRFHLGLLQFAGNGRLVKYIESLRAQTRQVRLTELHASGQLRRTAEEHFAILDAMVGGTEEEVGRLMTEHLDHVTADWGPTDSSVGASAE